MESRLLQLQEKMVAQQLESEKLQSMNGGNRWKSSRPDKGSIRAYGKEVNSNFKKKIEAKYSTESLLRSSSLPSNSTLALTSPNPPTSSIEGVVN